MEKLKLQIIKNLPDKQTDTTSTLCIFIASIIFFIPVDNIVVGPK